MINIQSLHKYYNKGKPNECHALRGVNLQITEGESVAIVGRSGAGKSTLLHVIGCVDGFDEGVVELDGRNIFGLKDHELARIRNVKFGIVLQDFALIPDCSVIENVMVPLYFNKMSNKRRKQKALFALEQMDLGDLADKNVNQLSGGQKQRVAIARAVANNPSYILADEPTGALDTKTADEIIGVLKEMNKSGITVIVVTHEKTVSDFCDRIITIHDGVIV
jgi:putative ABC transport system ATP-binding protein